LGRVTLILIPDGRAASLALKHQGGSQDSPAPSAAPKKAAAKGSPWDKGAAKPAATRKAPAAGPDAALGLPQPAEVSSMYVTAPVYGNIALDEPSAVTTMYPTAKFY
ncbi:hypothetical protein IWQ56_003715, partial [Coemansia nantahalensis]